MLLDPAMIFKDNYVERERIMSHDFFKTIQRDIYSAFQMHEPKAQFFLDEWTSALGSGVSAVIQEGDVLEKGGVNFSQVKGAALPKAASERHPELAGHPFTAMGVSVVIHPRNPYVPTSHFNVRLLEVELPDRKHWWVGGGFDLTPYYGFEEDCILWHQTAKDACDPFGANIYPEFKQWCDDYFHLKHRKEARGIGGLFFDDWNALSQEDSLKFLRSVTDAYIKAYTTIVAKRKNHPFSEQERSFQAYRHGRYVEFNLVYDRGTLFGLQSGGRTESILMSLPRHVEWRYDWQPEKGSPEEKLYTDFLPVRDWV